MLTPLQSVIVKTLTILLLLISSTLCAQVDFTSSNLPIILIETGGQAIPDSMDIVAQMSVIDNGPGNRNYVTDPSVDYDIGIQTRGHSSQYYFPKKQYGVNTGIDVSVLDMPAENKWVLQAPYSDKTFMRNVIIYQLARDMGYWAPRTRYCEVVLNGNYDGIYVFMEKVTQNSERINMEPPTDPNWGFIAEIKPNFHLQEDDIYFGSQYVDRFWVVNYPNSEDLTPDMISFITDKVTTFDTALYSGSLPDYRDQFDMASFTDIILLNGLTRNPDFFLASTFINSNYNDPLHLGPVWDFNIALGNNEYSNNWNFEGWSMNTQLWSAPMVFNPVHNIQEQLAESWSRRRQSVLRLAEIDDLLDDYTEFLTEAQERDFERWPRLGEHVWPNYFIGDTWLEEVQWLRDWMHDRVAWLDTQWGIEMPVDPVINEINYNSADDFDPGDWVEIYNPMVEPLDVSGWCLRDENDSHSFYLPAETVIPADGYLVLCNSIFDFSAAFPGVDAVGNIGFGFSGGGEIIRLFNTEGLLVDYVLYDDDAPWPTAPDGNGPTLELISNNLNNNLADNWSASSLNYGSPGEINGSFQPVMLASFSVEPAANGALLQWTVTADNLNFALTGNSNGNQWDVPLNQMQNYNWSALDQHPIGPNETVLYRLNVIDENGSEYQVGTVEYSPNFIPMLALNSISPNPAKNDVSIRFTPGVGLNTRIAIYDLAGRLVKKVPTGPAAQLMTLNVDNLATGVYLLSLENETGRDTQKLIIQR